MVLLNGKKRKIRETWLAFAVMFLLSVLSGCAGTVSGNNPGQESARDTGTKLTVVTTLFPYYDFVRQVAGDKVELSLIIPAGMDSHSFEPTPKDIRTMQNADLIIANGGEMELWVKQVADSLDREELMMVTMMDYVDVVEEEIVEGMEDDGDGHHHVHAYAGDEHGHAGHEEEEHHGHSHEDESQYEIEYDEHIWTSPVNAIKMVGIITDALRKADPENGSAYEEAAASYIKKLEELDAEFRAVRADAVHDMIIMGDKFPLRYFADEYGLRYRAAFSGCSSDTEPSARTIAYLIDKIKEENLPVIYYLELSSHRVAEIIAEETGAKPLLFHSCHNVTRREFEDGVTYLTLMEQNVKNLREGLCK